MESAEYEVYSRSGPPSFFASPSRKSSCSLPLSDSALASTPSTLDAADVATLGPVGLPQPAALTATTVSTAANVNEHRDAIAPSKRQNGPSAFNMNISPLAMAVGADPRFRLRRITARVEP